MRRGCTWVPLQTRDQLRICTLRVAAVLLTNGMTLTRNSVVSVAMLHLGASGVTRRQATASSVRIISILGGKTTRVSVFIATHLIRTASGATIQDAHRVQAAMLRPEICVRTFGVSDAE